MGFLSKNFKRPGESVNLLGFDDNLNTVELMTGYVKDGKLVYNSAERKGLELNEAEPINLIVKGKLIGKCYPVDLETSQGVKIRRIGIGGKTLYESERETKSKFAKAWIHFQKSPMAQAITKELHINARLVGAAIDSDRLQKSFNMKPERWQIAGALVVGVIVGLVIM